MQACVLSSRAVLVVVLVLVLVSISMLAMRRESSLFLAAAIKPCTRSCDETAMDAYGVTVRLSDCTMMCSMRDDVSQDVSNLQTSRLKPAVQQNRCLLLFPASSACLCLPHAITL